MVRIDRIRAKARSCNDQSGDGGGCQHDEAKKPLLELEVFFVRFEFGVIENQRPKLVRSPSPLS